jgi:hypothetical protein
LTFAVALGAAGGWRAVSERGRIDAAINRVQTSPLTFIRNDKEYDGKAAAQHLKNKLERAGDRIKTFDQFVEHIATKSSISGKPYLVKLEDGKTVELAAWIRQQDSAEMGK